MDEYLLIEAKNSGVNETIESLGCPYTKIQSKMTYYLIQAPNEKLKGLYGNGIKLMARFPEIPSRLSEFKKRFSDSLDRILAMEELPSIHALRHRVLLCSSGSGPSVEELSKRDEFISSVYSALAKLSVSNA